MYRDLILIGLALFTWGIGEGMFIPFDPIYLKQLGADPIAIGEILGAVGITMAVTQIPAGYLSDRFGRRPLVIGAWLMGLLSTALMAFAETLPVFVFGRMLYGLTAWVMTPLNSYITAARGRLSVGRVITLISAVYHAGAIAGPMIGGYVGDHGGLQITYSISAVLFLISNLIIWNIKPQPVEPVSKSGGSISLLQNPRYLTFLSAAFLAMFAIYLPQPLTPNYLQEVKALQFSQIGVLNSIGSTGIVVLNLLIGQIAAPVGFFLAQIAAIVFALLVWKGTGMIWLGVGHFFISGYRAARNLAAAQVRDLVQPANMGLAYGITEAVMLSSTILAPILAGYLYAQEPGWMYPASIVLIVLALAANISMQLFLRR